MLAAPLIAAALAGQAAPSSAPHRTCGYSESAETGRMYHDPFMVFFDWDSSAITPAAAATLDNAVLSFGPLWPRCAVEIAANADRSGTAAYNLALSRRRAASILAYLRGRGVTGEARLEGYGETRQLVETADGVREPQNRGAWIVSGPLRGADRGNCAASAGPLSVERHIPFEEFPLTVAALQDLEAEAIHIIREAVAEAERPVMLFSGGKDSCVMLHLARKAFFPARPPFPLLHVDTGWKFAELYAPARRSSRPRRGWTLIVHRNPEAEARGINPFDHGAALHTELWKTEGLKQALDAGRFDVAFGGARRDEEMSRAKERIFSVRSAGHGWDPKRQRPELWQLYNGRPRAGREPARLPALRLDRARRLGLCRAREARGRLALFRRRAADGASATAPC